VLRGHVAGEVEGKAKGVVQAKGVAAGDRRRSLAPQLVDEGIQEREPGVQRALEALLLLADDVENESRRRLSSS